MSPSGVNGADRIPSLSRIPKEMGRLPRSCDRCGRETEHILYRVPKKIAFFYIKDHAKNLHATCSVCAKSEIIASPERERLLEKRP